MSIIYTSDFSEDGKTFDELGPFDEIVKFGEESIIQRGTLDGTYQYIAESDAFVSTNVNEPMSTNQWIRIRLESSTFILGLLVDLTVVFMEQDVPYGQVLVLQVEGDYCSWLILGSKDGGIEGSGEVEVVPGPVDVVAHSQTDGVTTRVRLWVNGGLVADLIGDADELSGDEDITIGFVSMLVDESDIRKIHALQIGEGNPPASIISRSSESVTLPGAKNTTKYLQTPVGGGYRGSEPMPEPFIVSFAKTEGSGVGRVETISGNKALWVSDFSVDGLRFDDLGPFMTWKDGQGTHGTADGVYNIVAYEGDEISTSFQFDSQISSNQWAYVVAEGEMSVRLRCETINDSGFQFYIQGSEWFVRGPVETEKEFFDYGEVVVNDDRVTICFHVFDIGEQTVVRLYLDGSLVSEQSSERPESSGSVFLDFFDRGYSWDDDINDWVNNTQPYIIHEAIIGQGKTLPVDLFD